MPPTGAEYAFGFYSMMLTSTLIGLIVMVLYKPRTWCVFCPMGTTTQLICQAKARGCTDCGSCGTACRPVGAARKEEKADAGTR